ncbi:transcriptional regulator NrdR [Paraburkholderia silvatlantica]|uniref:Transcriptional repressor NrdR n=1 Tax=Paraburkholderia silvatlantica TaxID=321895 RepID=A0ABR6FQP7_9BURK|nr:transcriptional regulator NrdR [Paraburkholderia silvatlantica]MBB2929742.1 transcriptional repressor NrdR [Paraburkholderia silvatlantica]PVY34960.1 transcriptional repressor NrdR [Paraburkholderia silvatlantica]PXW39370.1 transcriptional repressor NrdR [Paraburkholderia silvatlantica]
MRCPFCRHEDTQVVDSRVSEDGAAIRRRRRCPACDKRFTTYERVELAMPAVVKKDGSRTEFDRRKIVASMQLALRKRPVAADAIDAAVARIEYQLLGSGEREVRSERLGELVMGELRELDKVAFVRFASVYRRFEDVSEFEDVIEEFRRAGAANNHAKKR